MDCIYRCLLYFERSQWIHALWRKNLHLFMREYSNFNNLSMLVADHVDASSNSKRQYLFSKLLIKRRHRGLDSYSHCNVKSAKLQQHYSLDFFRYQYSRLRNNYVRCASFGPADLHRLHGTNLPGSLADNHHSSIHLNSNLWVYSLLFDLYPEDCGRKCIPWLLFPYNN